ncbi:hypothetical protein EJF18_50112 [Clavispora lusitaniae]|uniref:Uncharacterized protein n=1 Tax=Clavispora lusitaniae TaxID=36911 RepID=A0ACD0WMY6_CLALS|nr:hypothetical protein EJF14_50112 [Clavispora lusitaniae]QFZ34557.1 hypothetical protein EJF16_50112 [Clavispora lusitaniae]QFZ40242.1 hypothetical protein EJF15_50112 [Clavispora lusitaniae]QFZ45922.1 hypothetical protein EJF18_50112 [Clavispora lusitaniae]QFZ51584.1 hypothetical protein EJF17_50112 [Clavispora lusitaniae]
MTKWYLQFTKFHYYLIPIVCAVVWWGMLIALLACWGAQGHPIYSFMKGKHQDPVYLSDIGATNLQPLFIACTGFQMIFFMGTLIMEYVLRKKHKLQPYVSTKQPKLAIASIICGCIGEIGILLVACFKTSKFKHVHFAMVGVFIAFVFFACCFNFTLTFIFGNFPQRLHPNHEKVIFGKRRWANLYMVSFFLKIIWVIFAIVFAVAFGALMNQGYKSASAVFEWIICYWYGFLLLIWSLDLFPSAVKSYRLHHPEKFDTEFIDNHKIPVEARSSLEVKHNSTSSSDIMS